MEIRRLNKMEHIRTRALYEEVFPVDDSDFVDYYYQWKTRDNVIYAAEDDQGIHAMVHLNPFWVSVDGKVRRLHYIVAVATQASYRHQGLMRRLLQAAEAEMAEAGEKVTFLMPASEKIYLPFGYRFFGWQKKGVWKARRPETAVSAAGGSGRTGDLQEISLGKSEDAVSQKPEESEDVFPEAICRPAKPEEWEELARFANRILKRQYDVFVCRDRAYYERLCAEQQCQGGQVMVIRETQRYPGEAPEKMRLGEAPADVHPGEVPEKMQFGEAPADVNPGEAPEKMRLGEAPTDVNPGEAPEKMRLGEGPADVNPGEAPEKMRFEEALTDVNPGEAPANAYPDKLPADCRETGEAAGRIIGVFCTARTENREGSPLELREIIFDPERMEKAVEAVQCFVDGQGDCRVSGCQADVPLEEERMEPLMMGKCPGQGVFESPWETDRVFLNEVV